VNQDLMVSSRDIGFSLIAWSVTPIESSYDASIS